MLKKVLEVKTKVKTVIGVYKDMSKDKAYLDKICDALYALPDEVDYSGVQKHVEEAIDAYEVKYDVKYSHPFVLPSNTVDED